MVGEMISSTASSFAAIAGGIGGALVLMGVIILVCFCMFHYKRYSNRNSDTASSDPSAPVEQKTGGPVSSLALARGGVPEGARVFRMQELEQATKNFDESNLIGCGSFGLVFKGFLFDGTIVAIKTRSAPPRQQFSEEVARLSMTQHRNLVNLLGYCQENGYQILVLEYLPNGTMCNHLYGMGRDSSTKLEFKQRLSIASGTAKGLCHLHGQCPPVVHGNFKTGNVLVDENFIPKVADAGISSLLKEINHDAAGPSHSIQPSPFIDPEVNQSGVFSEASDIYGFGVFLWELITGREAAHIRGLGSNQTMLQWVEAHLSSDDLVEHRLMGKYSAEGMRDLIRLAMRCTSFPGKERPNMDMVAVEAERILEKEIMGSTAMGEASATLTLGSQLFTN
ncbi:PREDICTED: putative serine/threonine-protein kinase isoform X2 [Ipomoea nil]|nr:PREDICTED: putative serine/threonine-protein kinase isoform X1 [Ipomoea nil]XP_019175058.1 PREDICTED: putative serine/threonine-protein kinase isoform X2 [Ipomoea nil]